MSYAPIPAILKDLAEGRMIVLVDDEKRENEGDLVCAAQCATPPLINFMLTEGRGMMCAALDGSICDRLNLTPQAPVNTTQRGTAYTISVDATQAHGITTGVSAADRATTMQLLADPNASASDFARPGHTHPLRARDGGVLVRTGQTEGSVDLCRLAGLSPAAVIIEIMNPDGTMARRPELQAFCKQHELKMCSVADIIAYRLEQDILVKRILERPIDTALGRFNLIAYQSRVDPYPHVTLSCGQVGRQTVEHPVLVRVHAQNLLGDVFAAVDYPTGRSLHQAMQRIAERGEGAIVYLRCPGMGYGDSRPLQTPTDTQADESIRNRTIHDPKATQLFDFGIGSQILRDLGIRRMQLLCNRHVQLNALEGFGLKIEQQILMDDETDSP